MFDARKLPFDVWAERAKRLAGGGPLERRVGPTCWPLACCVDLVSATNLLGPLGNDPARSRDVRAPLRAAASTKLLCRRRLVPTYYLPVSANAKRAAVWAFKRSAAPGTERLTSRFARWTLSRRTCNLLRLRCAFIAMCSSVG